MLVSNSVAISPMLWGKISRPGASNALLPGPPWVDSHIARSLKGLALELDRECDLIVV